MSFVTVSPSGSSPGCLPFFISHHFPHHPGLAAILTVSHMTRSPPLLSRPFPVFLSCPFPAPPVLPVPCLPVLSCPFPAPPVPPIPCSSCPARSPPPSSVTGILPNPCQVIPPPDPRAHDPPQHPSPSKTFCIAANMCSLPDPSLSTHGPKVNHHA